MPEAKKKNIFTTIANAFTDKDEKEAIKAQVAAAAKAAEDKAAAAKAAADKAAAEKAALEKAEEARKAEAKKRLEEMAAKAEETRKATEEKIAAAAAAAAEAAKPKFIAEHKLGADETLSHVALKHYGNAARPYWMLIYEANQAVIGDNPGIITPGTVLNLPELPENLK